MRSSDAPVAVVVVTRAAIAPLHIRRRHLLAAERIGHVCEEVSRRVKVDVGGRLSASAKTSPGRITSTIANAPTAFSQDVAAAGSFGGDGSA